MQVAGSAGRQRMRGLNGKAGGICDRMTYGQRCFTIWYTLWVVVFIIVGAAYTSVWKNDKRAANITLYNSVVSQFNAQRAAFADVEVNVTLVRLWPPTAANAQPDLSAEDYATWTLGVGPQRMTAYSPADALADSSASSDGASSYTTLAYAGPLTQQWLPDSLFDKDLQFAYRVNVTSKATGKSSLIASSTNGYGAFSPFTVQTLSPQDIGCDTGKYCAQSCVDVGGVWSYPVCTIYYMMTAMCFRVSPHPTESDTWVFDDSFGDGDDGGCGWFQNRFAVGTYTPVVYARDTRYQLGTAMRAWTVRLGNDPWTYASWITSGTLNFGNGSPSAKGASIACLLLGFLALGAGLAYAIWARYTGRWTSFSADGILGAGARDGGTLSGLEAPSAKRDRDAADGAAADGTAAAATTAVMVDDGSQAPSPATTGGAAAAAGGGPSYSADVAAALADGPLQRPVSPNAAEDNGR